MPRILTVTLNPALDISTETPEVRPGPKLRCAAPVFDPGGGGINVSRAIRFLGGDSLPLAALGGATGQQMRELLRAEGLSPGDLGVGHLTRQSLAVRETSSGRQFRFVLPGPDWSAADCAAAAERIADAAGAGDIVVASGSQPPGVPPDFFPALNDRLAPRGVRMALDTSGAPLAAAARRKGAPLAALRMDRDEAESLAGRSLPDAEAAAGLAAELVASGAAEIAAVAIGAEGTVIATRSGRTHCRPPAVEVVSKVGAGDSFVAGFALALARGETPEAACRLGVAAAASAVRTPATRLCDGADTRRLLPLVACRPI